MDTFCSLGFIVHPGKSIFLGLQSLCGNITHKHIRILSDNTTTVSYINAMGGIKSQVCNDMAHLIWGWCTKRNIWLSACHIPGVQNSKADTESRKFNESTEWSLDSQVFDNILAPFAIDLFASRLNCKVATYVSWKPDPGASFINAFQMDWQHHYFYAFPFFSLIFNMLTEDRVGKNLRGYTSSSLENATMVHDSSSLIGRQTSTLPSVHCAVDTTPQQCSSSSKKSHATDCMQSVRETIQLRGVSGKAAEIILRSWSEGHPQAV